MKVGQSGSLAVIKDTSLSNKLGLLFKAFTLPLVQRRRLIMSTVYLHPSNPAKTRVLFALSPTANGVALMPERGDLYFAAFDVPEPYDRVFLVDTYSIFAGLQELERLDQEERSQAGAYSRIASLLRSKLLDQITRLEVGRALCVPRKR
jgi:hypothetical protein